MLGLARVFMLVIVAALLAAGCGVEPVGTPEPVAAVDEVEGALDEEPEATQGPPSEDPSAEPTEYTPTAAEERQAIRRVYEKYQRSVQGGFGESATTAVTEQTIDYYDKLAKLAVTAGPKRLQRATITDQLTVAVLRAVVKPKFLAQSGGEDVLAMVIELRLFDTAGAEPQLGKITISGDLAIGRANVDGQPLPTTFEFRKEDGDWRFQPTSLLPATNFWLDDARRREGLSKQEFVLAVINSIAPKRLQFGPELYRAPKVQGEAEI